MFWSIHQDNFYPRPPRGGRHRVAFLMTFTSCISIHALREEGDCRWTALSGLRPISIHALREEGDFALVNQAAKGSRISIHALREEGDASVILFMLPFIRFLSTPSARRATQYRIQTAQP